MKKALSLVLAVFLSVGLFAACNKQESKEGKTEENGLQKVEALKVAFVPSRDPDQIVAQTEPLKKLLQTELKKHGFDVQKVEISVGNSYEAVGESLSSGTVDVGFIPGGTYVLYQDSADVILTATRKGLSVDSENPDEWNNNKPTKQVKDQVTFYRSLFIVGPSEKGKALAEKIKKGEKPSWEDLNGLNWSVMNSSSSSGYIYPYLWLKKHYNKGITDLEHVLQADSYGSSFARLAANQVDVLVCYSDARLDNAKKWTEQYKREKSIWDETNVIGVSGKIYNDTISVSKNSKIMNDKMKQALIDSFIDIAKTDEGKKVIKIYNHEGYKKAEAKDYDSERDAQKLLKELKKK